ncbi:MAG: putative peptidase [Phycisphaerales bacterium]|jgi:predicted peptidase
MKYRSLAVYSLLGVLSFSGAVFSQPETPETPETPAMPAMPDEPAAFRHETIVVIDADGDTHDYAYSVWRSPALEEGEAAPAIVFLHGYGECGTDGEKQLHVGLPPQLVANPERWPFVVLIPQKPVYNSEWEDHDAAVSAMMTKEFERESVDPDRVVITGLSQGGHGTLAMATLHPDGFRAVAPVCGYIDRWNNDGEKVRAGTLPDSPTLAATVEALHGHPVWIFHGGRDDVVNPGESRLLHGALRDAGGKAVKLTVFPDDNHNSWDSAYGLPEFAAWLVEHTAEWDD